MTLVEINYDNLLAVIGLEVVPEQRNYVADNAVSIAEARFKSGGWYRAVYAGEVPVGFVMLFDPTVPGAIATDPVEPTGMVGAVRAHIVDLGRFRKLLSNCVPRPDGPESYYLSYGFRKTGRFSD